jgi:hypothetical protein
MTKEEIAAFLLYRRGQSFNIALQFARDPVIMHRNGYATLQEFILEAQDGLEATIKDWEHKNPD